MSRAERATASHNARLLFITGAGALVVAIGLSYTALTYRLSHRGQVTDRFTKALERLGSAELYVRIGAIHSLTHVLRDSADHHADVLQVLVAFVRQRAPRVTGNDSPNPIYPRPNLRTEPDSDVQAAMTVIAARVRRPRHEPPGILDLARLDLTGVRLPKGQLQGAYLAGAQMQRADLRGAQLRGADLRGAQMQRADLRGAQLRGADLTEAQLQVAELSGAQLQGANLARAQLQNARLFRAQMQGANVAETQLQGAYLAGAQLQGAYLAGAQFEKTNLAGAQLQKADLSGSGLGIAAVQGLSIDCLAKADIDEGTELPFGMREDLQAYLKQLK
ncbi:pentapeptide repeat-containing protein [Micromonospora sp. NPDC023888]|uniref:pentapeptide repeat-containing protein n=1 Tax=Micromonospora sp. NPDC023888 TaxID=3155607 RepID=UPI0033D35F57